MEEKKRLKKFKREKDAVRVEIQPRDIEILQSLADYRFLNTLQIMALHPGGERNMKLRLQKLFHAGFLDRPPHQLSYHRPLGHMIYGLGNKGADFLAERRGFDRSKVDWRTKNREAKERYILHTLMVSNFRVILNLALNNHEEGRLIDWQQGKGLRSYVRLDDQKIAIVPDAFFTMEDSRDTMWFFIEADHSTMTTGRFLKKLQAYWRWYRSEGHAERFGITSFRVLTICKSDARKENLRRIAREADDRKKGTLMFWFASEKDIDLAHPERILAPIWQTPVDDNWHFLLEE